MMANWRKPHFFNLLCVPTNFLICQQRYINSGVYFKRYALQNCEIWIIIKGETCLSYYSIDFHIRNFVKPEKYQYNFFIFDLHIWFISNVYLRSGVSDVRNIKITVIRGSKITFMLAEMFNKKNRRQGRVV